LGLIYRAVLWTLKFQVHTAARVKMAVFWVVAPFILVMFTDVSEMLAASICSKHLYNVGKHLLD
jgi:hypothetical protein